MTKEHQYIIDKLRGLSCGLASVQGNVGKVGDEGIKYILQIYITGIDMLVDKIIKDEQEQL